MFDASQRMILAIVIVVYFFFLILVSLYFNRKTKTYEDYNVAGRSVSIFPIILTFVGTAVGGSTLLGYMENGYLMGMGQQWLNIGSFITGIILATFMLKKIRKIGQKNNMITVGDYTAYRFGEPARLPTVISMLIAYAAVTGMQFVGLATVLKLTLGINISLAIIIVWIFLTIKTYFGGLKSVIWQDALHGTVQTIGIVVLVIVVLVASGGWGNISDYASSTNNGGMLSLFNISPGEVLVYVFTIGAYQLVRQDIWQRFWAAESLKTSLNGFWISITLSLIIGLLTVIIGIIGKFGLKLTDVDPQLIYYGIVEDVFPFPMVIIMIITVLVTVISSADSFFISGATSIVNDLIRPRMKEFNDKKMLFYSKISVVIVSVIALLFALMIPELVELWVTGTAMLVSGLLAPVIIGMYWNKVTKRAGVLSMWFGLGSAVIWQIMGQPFDVQPVFIGLPISIIVLLIVTIFDNSQQNESYEEIEENL